LVTFKFHAISGGEWIEKVRILVSKYNARLELIDKVELSEIEPDKEWSADYAFPIDGNYRLIGSFVVYHKGYVKMNVLARIGFFVGLLAIITENLMRILIGAVGIALLVKPEIVVRE